MVLEVYRITLLSNALILAKVRKPSFRGLQNYTTLKLDKLKNDCQLGFRGLQNYTTLKLVVTSRC